MSPDLHQDPQAHRLEILEAEVLRLRAELQAVSRGASAPMARVGAIDLRWQLGEGRCFFADLPVAMMWIDTTLAGLMKGLQSMVGTPRFLLALQSEGRHSVAADWEVIEAHPDFPSGFKAIAHIAAVAGWGAWELRALDEEARLAVFRVRQSWEGRVQQSLGVSWGCGMLAGKFAGYCTRLFGTNCWADQTAFSTQGAPFEEFVVRPSLRSEEAEMDDLLATDSATRADMAVALERLRQAQALLEKRVEARTSELAAAHHQALASEARLRKVFENSPMGLHLYEWMEGQLVFSGANRAADRILGVDNQQFVGKTLEMAFPPLVHTEIPFRYRRVLETGQPWHTQQVNYADGRISGAYEVHAFAADTTTLVVLFMDITSRLRDEKEREDLQNQLHRSRKMEALGMLAGGVAHDLNNILAGVVSFPDILLADLPPESPMVRPLQIIQASGNRAAEVVQDLLAVARGGAPSQDLVALNDVVTDLLDSIEGRSLLAHHPQVQVTRDLEPGLLYCRGSAHQLRKALMNLLSNALEAVQGTGLVKVTTRNQYLDRPQKGELRATVGEFVVVSVEDTGQGISAEDRDRIFEPFYSRKVMGRSGTGLGLTVVWNTVQAHRGFVDVHPMAVGTRFDLSLPATRELPETVPPPEPLPLLKGHGEHVLVVDDEPLQRDIACGMLRLMGYQPMAVDGAEGALAHVREGHPVDLLLLDMIMPTGLSGRETYRRLLEVRPGLPAVIASGYAETQEVAETQAMGAGPFLKKPFSLEQLGQALREVLG